MTTENRRPTTEGNKRLTVAIIARDEAQHIGGALASIQGLTSDVLLLLDDRTSDATAVIAQQHGARVVVEPWRGFSVQRNRALDLCQSEWVLFLDADERVTDELREEILQIVDCRLQISSRESAICNLQSAISGYWIPRHNQFFGKTVRGGGWYPDHQLRLLRRSDARYNENQFVHEFAQLVGGSGYLHGHIDHINIERFDEFWQKQRSYASQEAQTLFREERRVRYRNFVGAPAREFLRRFVQLGGWRDGLLGVALCGTLAYFELVKFVHLKALFHATRRQEGKKTRR